MQVLAAVPNVCQLLKLRELARPVLLQYRPVAPGAPARRFRDPLAGTLEVLANYYREHGGLWRCGNQFYSGPRRHAPSGLLLEATEIPVILDEDFHFGYFNRDYTGDWRTPASDSARELAGSALWHALAESTEGVTPLDLDSSRGDLWRPLRPLLPELELVVSHPCYPDAERPRSWVCTHRPPTPSEHRPAGGSASYPHLNTLTSAYPLTPASRLRYLAFLLAACRADLAHCPTPFLLVESWGPMLGKSELTEALSLLLNGGDYLRAPASHHARGLRTDELTAALRDPRLRLLVLENLGGPGYDDWGENSLYTLLTQGVYEARGKYQALTSQHARRLVCANGNVGQFSLPIDLRTRTWRVELTGPAPGRTYSPRACDYVRGNRPALYDEIWRALESTRAVYWEFPVARQQDFARAGLAAAAHVLGIPHDEAFNHLESEDPDCAGLSEEMRTAVRVYLDSLAERPPELEGARFLRPRNITPGTAPAPGTAPGVPEGARLAGFTVRSGRLT